MEGFSVNSNEMQFITDDGTYVDNTVVGRAALLRKIKAFANNNEKAGEQLTFVNISVVPKWLAPRSGGALVEKVMGTISQIGHGIASQALTDSAWVADGIERGSGLDMSVGSLSSAVAMDTLKSNKILNGSLLDGLESPEETYNQLGVPDVEGEEKLKSTFKDIVELMVGRRRSNSTAFGIVNHAPISAIMESQQTFRSGILRNDLVASFPCVAETLAQAGNHMGGLVKFVQDRKYAGKKLASGVADQMDGEIKKVEVSRDLIEQLGEASTAILDGIVDIGLIASSVIDRDENSAVPSGEFVELAQRMVEKDGNKESPLELYAKFTREWSVDYMAPNG